MKPQNAETHIRTTKIRANRRIPITIASKEKNLIWAIDRTLARSPASLRSTQSDQIYVRGTKRDHIYVRGTKYSLASKHQRGVGSYW